MQVTVPLGATLKVTCESPSRVRPALESVENVYIDGTALLLFLHEEFGADRVRAVLANTAPEFWLAVKAELGLDAAGLYERWEAWRRQRCPAPGPAGGGYVPRATWRRTTPQYPKDGRIGYLVKYARSPTRTHTLLEPMQFLARLVSWYLRRGIRSCARSACSRALRSGVRMSGRTGVEWGGVGHGCDRQRRERCSPIRV